jgi:hypothetical protein
MRELSEPPTPLSCLAQFPSRVSGVVKPRARGVFTTIRTSVSPSTACCGRVDEVNGFGGETTPLCGKTHPAAVARPSAVPGHKYGLALVEVCLRNTSKRKTGRARHR